MSNINNYGVVTGRLLKDVAVFKNEDGSYRSEVNINVDIDGNYADKNKAKQSETVLLEGLIEAGQKDNSVYNKMHKIYSMSIEKLYVKRRWSTCDPLSDYLLPAVDIDISKERLSKFKYYNIAEIVRKQQAQLQLDDTEDKTIKDNYYTALFYFSQMMACFVPFQKSKRR